MSRWIRMSLVTGLLIFSVVASPAEATVITRLASTEFSGATAPEGTAPWLTVRFDDGGGSGSVTLTFEATNLVNSEFASSLYLNVADGVNLSSLSFLNPVKTGGFDTPTISRGTDQFKAAGDGYFDILLSFATGGGASKRFSAGDVLSYTISAPSLTAASFDALSASGSKPGHSIAVHVQGIGQNGDFSGWVTAPEPSTLSLLGLSAAGILRRRRRR